MKPLRCLAAKMERVLFWVWLACLIPPGTAQEARTAVDAVARASGHPEVRERVGRESALRVEARFVDRWEIWMVEYVEDGQRLAFATVNEAGEVLEVGGGEDGEEAEEAESQGRIRELRRELERARETDNEAEIREITTLLREMGVGPEGAPVLDVEAWLESVHGLGGYGMSLLRWSPVRGGQVQIERRLEGGWDLVGLAESGAGTWIDEGRVPGESLTYRLRWQSAPEEEPSASSRSLTVKVRDVNDSTLPVYHLTLPEEERERMLADVTEDITIEGELQLGEVSYGVELRLRGASTRHAAKKSYRVRFLGESPLDRKVTYLKAEPMDHTMQQEKLSCDLFRAANHPVSRADYVNVTINGRFEGVYLDMEPIRSPFKKHPELNPRGTLIRASTFQHLGTMEPVGNLRGDVGSLDEFREFIHEVNRVDRGEFEAFVRTHMDWPRVRDYLALQVICHRSEIEADDYLVYRAPETGKWSLLPRDHNNGNFHVLPYGNRVGEPYMLPYWQTIQQLGWRPNYWFVLPSRIFHQPGLRGEYLERLEFLVEDLVLSGHADRLIDQNHALLLQEYVVDPYRTPYEGLDPFLRADQDLKRFLRQHTARLLERVDRERNRESEEAGVVINEFALTGPGEGWVELMNRGSANVVLSQAALVTKQGERNAHCPVPFMVLKPGERELVIFDSRRWEVSGRDERGENDDERGALLTGLGPEGGFLGLVDRGEAGEEAVRGEDARERLLDFYFFGERNRETSYGRWREGHAVLKPSMGRPNEAWRP